MVLPTNPVGNTKKNMIFRPFNQIHFRNNSFPFLFKFPYTRNYRECSAYGKGHVEVSRNFCGPWLFTRYLTRRKVKSRSERVVQASRGPHTFTLQIIKKTNLTTIFAKQLRNHWGVPVIKIQLVKSVVQHVFFILV